jgi:hypothetical protein
MRLHFWKPLDLVPSRFNHALSSLVLAHLGLVMHLELTIHPLTQFPARLEVRNILLRHRHPLSGLRIPACVRRAVVDLITAEAADLDAPAVDQARGRGFENRLNNNLDVLRGQPRIVFRQLGD